MGYNAALAVYYYISIHTWWTESEFKQRVEPWLHIIPFVYSVAGVAIGLATQMYSTNDMFLYCWAAPSPFGCRYDGNGDEGGTCEHGNTYRAVFVFLGGLVEMNLLTSVKIIATFTLYYTVLKQQQKMQTKYHAKTTGNTIAKETGIQAILFFLSCVIPYGFMIILRVMDLFFWQEDIVNTTGFFWFSAFAQFMFPLQGACNMICYFRPKVKERQRRSTGESLIRSTMVLIQKSQRTTVVNHSKNPYAKPSPSQSKPVHSLEDDTELDMTSRRETVHDFDDIGYMQVEELEKACQHSCTFVLGEDMLGDTKNRVMEVQQRQRKSKMIQAAAIKEDPELQEEHHSATDMEEVLSEDSAGNSSSSKRVDFSGGVTRLQSSGELQDDKQVAEPSSD